jgi:hypothetical protein
VTGPEYIKIRRQFIELFAWAVSQQVERGQDLDKVIDAALRVLAVEAREEVQRRITY